MPHCIIDLTKNISNNKIYKKLMKDISKAINVDNIFISDDIKIRIIEIEYSFMGIDEQEHSYVATEIVLLGNKDEEQYKKIKDSVHNVVSKNFEDIVHKCSITTRLTLIDSKNYQRSVNY